VKPHLNRNTHIVGTELVNKVLQESFKNEVIEKIFIVAYNNKCHGTEGLKDENLYKRHHIREVCRHYNVKPNQILLFDDEQANVDDCRKLGVVMSKVDPAVGFRISDFPQL